MKDSCGVDMGKTSGDLSRLVTTIPLDHAHHRVKPKLLNMNATQVVVVVVVLMFVIVLVDRYGQMERIGQLERKQQDQEALIQKIQEDLRRLGGNVGGGGQSASYDTTEAEEQPQKTVTSNERQSQSHSVTRLNQATVSNDGEENQISNERRTDDKGAKYLKRSKRPAADPPPSEGSSEENTTSTRQKRKGSKKDRKKKTVKKCRQDSSTCGTPTCEFVHECNAARHRNRSHCNHFVAQFEQPNDSNQLIDDVIGNWKYASWAHTENTHKDKLRIKSRLENFPDRPRKSTIEVRETGIYYVYSQITFADESSYLGHSVLIDDEIKFSCSLWVTGLQANTCTTGGLVKIEAHQLIHIQLIENNRIINMDSENTFFGIIHVMSLP